LPEAQRLVRYFQQHKLISFDR